MPYHPAHLETICLRPSWVLCFQSILDLRRDSDDSHAAFEGAVAAAAPAAAAAAAGEGARVADPAARVARGAAVLPGALSFSPRSCPANGVGPWGGAAP